MLRDANVAKSRRYAFASRRRDPVIKRQALLKTAAQLFLEKSYRRTSLNEVAKRLNVTKPTLDNYFQNREDILLGCYCRGTTLIEERLNKIAVQYGTGSQLGPVRRRLHR